MGRGPRAGSGPGRRARGGTRRVRSAPAAPRGPLPGLNTVAEEGRKQRVGCPQMPSAPWGAFLGLRLGPSPCSLGFSHASRPPTRRVVSEPLLQRLGFGGAGVVLRCCPVGSPRDRSAGTARGEEARSPIAGWGPCRPLSGPRASVGPRPGLVQFPWGSRRRPSLAGRLSGEGGEGAPSVCEARAEAPAVFPWEVKGGSGARLSWTKSVRTVFVTGPAGRAQLRPGSVRRHSV